jgi:hypothetical protein
MENTAMEPTRHACAQARRRSLAGEATGSGFHRAVDKHSQHHSPSRRHTRDNVHVRECARGEGGGGHTGSPAQPTLHVNGLVLLDVVGVLALRRAPRTHLRKSDCPQGKAGREKTHTKAPPTTTVNGTSAGRASMQGVKPAQPRDVALRCTCTHPPPPSPQCAPAEACCTRRCGAAWQ